MSQAQVAYMPIKREKSFSFDRFRKTIGLPLAVLFGSLILFMPQPEGLSLAGQKSLAIFAVVLTLYLTESIHVSVTSLAVMPLAVLLGAGKMNQVLPPYASGTVFLMFGSFVLAAAMVQTRLAERITYVALSKTRGSAKSITFGIVMVSTVLAFLLPSSTARTAILLPIALIIIDMFKTEDGKRSNFAVNILLTIAFVNAILSGAVLTGSPPNIIAVDFMAKAGLPAVDYMQWLIAGFPPAFLMTLFTWWLMHVVFPSEKKQLEGGTPFIRERLERLGPMTGAEKRLAVILGATVALWVTGSWTGLNITVVCICAVVLFFMPYIGVLSWEKTSKELSWSILLVSGGGLAMGGLLIQTGAAKWLAERIFDTFSLGALGLGMMLLVIIVIVQYAHILFATTVAMATVFVPVIIELAKTAGMDPVLLTLVTSMLISAFPLLMFYNTIPLIIVYGTGKLRVDDFLKTGPAICGVACLVYYVCAVTYWPAVLAH